MGFSDIFIKYHPHIGNRPKVPFIELNIANLSVFNRIYINFLTLIAK